MPGSAEAINEACSSATKVVTSQKIRPYARACTRYPSKPQQMSGRSAIIQILLRKMPLL